MMLIWNVDAENQMAEKITMKYVGANVQKKTHPL